MDKAKVDGRHGEAIVDTAKVERLQWRFDGAARTCDVPTVKNILSII